jgi:hypothetical protein
MTDYFSGKRRKHIANLTLHFLSQSLYSRADEMISLYLKKLNAVRKVWCNLEKKQFKINIQIHGDENNAYYGCMSLMLKELD